MFSPSGLPRTSWKAVLLPVISLLAFSTLAFTAEIDSTSLTAIGSNTHVVVTGTFGPNAPTTAYSAPHAPYTLSFTVPTVPTSFVALNDDPPVFVLDTVATVNGVSFASSTAGFFTPDLGGGISVCLGLVCSPAHQVQYLNFEIYAQQLYTGSYFSPTLVAGVAHVDSVQSYIEYTTPEPFSAALAGLGLGLLAATRVWRRSVRAGREPVSSDGAVCHETNRENPRVIA